MPQHKNETTIVDNREDYTVRIRFRLPKDKLNIESSEIALGSIGKDKVVTLNSIDGKTKISEAVWLVLKSEGWSNEADAQAGAELLVDILCKSLAANNLSADLGRRTSGGGFFFKAFLSSIEQTTGKVVLNDECGPMVYKTSLSPLMAMVNGISAHIKVNQERFVTAFSQALKRCESYTEKERMASDLFAMAQKSVESADARFVLLFAALETLIEPVERPVSSREHVEQLIKLTKNSDLPGKEKDSIIQQLKIYKNRSIRWSGRQFVENRLGDTEIIGLKPVEIFLKSYDLRNRLMHGLEPLADWKDVSNLVGQLEQMLSLILAKESKL
jgi:hypothetical protein